MTQIKLQHSWCFGSCPIDEVTLNADGQAEFAGHRNAARQGLYRGRIAPEEFAKLAKFLKDQNFFELRPEIGSGNIDAPDVIVSVTRNELPYSVAFRLGARATLKTEIEERFARSIAQIGWQKDTVASNSGVRGTVRRDFTSSEARSYASQNFKDFPMQFALVTLTSIADFSVRQTTRTDQEGRFQFFGPPGRYSVDASDANFSRQVQLDQPRWNAKAISVEIKADEFALATLQMHGNNPDTKSKPVAQPKRVLPTIKSADLNGKPFALPDDLTAPRTLLLVAFEREHQALVDSWATALKLSPDDKDWFELPVVGAMSEQRQNALDNSMRGGIRGENKRSRVITLYTDRLQFLQSLGLGESNTGTILVLVVSPQGEILEWESGGFDRENAQKIIDAWRVETMK